MASSDSTPDLCVIGASEAGLAACMGAVALGLTCVLVDDGDPSGLTNPDLLLAALCHAASEPATAFGNAQRALARAAPERRHARYAAMNVRLLRGTGHFVDAEGLSVEGQTIRARRFLIATGGRQPSDHLAEALPAGVRLAVSDLPRLPQLPDDILVLGSGPEAVSVAQSLARIGSRVTLATEAVLPGLDPELTAILEARLRQDGVDVVPGRPVAMRVRDGRVAADLSDDTTVSAGVVLLAEERRPALAGLRLDQAGIARVGDDLRLDEGLRTSRRHILAAGRAAGARSSAEGLAQAGLALRAAFFHLPGRRKATAVPTVTATQPEIASVGDLQGSGAGDRVWRWPLAQTGGGALLGSEAGRLKVRTDSRGRILGVGLVGASVRELLPFWTLAVARGMTLAELAEVLPPTPSLSESIRAIATQDLGRRLASPWVRRTLRAARWLG